VFFTNQVEPLTKPFHHLLFSLCFLNKNTQRHPPKAFQQIFSLCITSSNVELFYWRCASIEDQFVPEKPIDFWPSPCIEFLKVALGTWIWILN